MITYSDIVINKFCFSNIVMSREFQDYIWSLPLPDTGNNQKEIRYKWVDVPKDIRSKIIKEVIPKVSAESFLLEQLHQFYFDINKIQKGEYVPMHNELAQKSSFEFILWMTKTDDYEGRDFIMKSPEFSKSYRPKNGDICFLDTTSPQTYHGVSKLISDTEVISIVGGLKEWECDEFKLRGQ